MGHYGKGSQPSAKGAHKVYVKTANRLKKQHNVSKKDPLKKVSGSPRSLPRDEISGGWSPGPPPPPSFSSPVTVPWIKPSLKRHKISTGCHLRVAPVQTNTILAAKISPGSCLATFALCNDKCVMTIIPSLHKG